jgi:hypothetical protein
LSLSVVAVALALVSVIPMYLLRTGYKIRG